MGINTSLSVLARRLERIENRHLKEEDFPERQIELRGANLEIQTDESKEVLLVGSAGTGKTTAILNKIYNLCMEHPRIRVAMVRKTRASLVETALVTWEQHILGYGHPMLSGASRQNRLNYVFPNGSRINIVGMDKPDRVLSADYDVIYVCESHELEESDAEALMSRLRNGKLHYQQLIMDCNPQAESHWLFQRQAKGQLKMLTSKHQDNPAYYDINTKDWTPLGKDYLENTLGKSLTGVRYKRLFLGIWCSAEGAVFEFDRNRHITNNLPPMKRYIVGVDWGHKDAGAMVCVGEGRDGCLYVVEEIMKTGQTLQYWESEAFRMMRQYGDIQFVCDPSIASHIQAFQLHGLPAIKAYNKIQIGIDLVQQRFNRDKLKVYAFSCKQEDFNLRDKRLPTKLVEEIEQYVWNETKDAPKDGNNHALDALRYAVVQIDRPRAEMIPITSMSQGLFANNRRRPSNPKISRRYRTTNR
jgi:phage terminase large subunit